ncbi:MAG TPA: hypothetical protein ENG63_09510 [Candidatus Desulfofervidus auxilii]|uniref:Nitroreductase domain-containing protein n=1 Tax=Desulfofervidus auxilii TaxID=1621989 RepID=A0A7C0U3Q2_DESA2|nr:hypothetical protein [Candidatus Desulfofervidus auxilii]
MEVKEAIYKRQSIRGFLSKSVDNELIIEILKAAIQAPSACNIQPWEFIVIKGKAKENLVKALLSAYKKEKRPSRTQASMPEKYKNRMKQLFEAIKTFAEKTPNFDIWQGSLSFYNAPVVIIVAKHKEIAYLRLLDIGLAIQNLMLMAQNLGLSTCPIGLTLRYEDIIKETLSLPDTLELVLTIALGYPDNSLYINKFRATKIDLKECVHWIE